MKICFLGVGGVGGYFGALVANRFRSEHEIYFIARGIHKESICKDGLTLKRADGKEKIIVTPKICTDLFDDLPICDIIILSVKGYDLSFTAKEMGKISNQETIILPLLNGVDIYQRIREHLPVGIVLPSCVYMVSRIESPGVIHQAGGNCKILMGKDPKFPDIYPESLISLLRDSEIDVEWEENIETSIWSKYIFIAAYGLVSAAYEKTLGEIMADSELSKTTRSIMFEIEDIAKRLKISLKSDIVDNAFLKAGQFPFEAKTSLQRDVEIKGKKNEGDLFGGTLIRFAKDLNLLIPNIESVYKLLLNKI